MRQLGWRSIGVRCKGFGRRRLDLENGTSVPFFLRLSSETHERGTVFAYPSAVVTMKRRRIKGSAYGGMPTLSIYQSNNG